MTLRSLNEKDAMVAANTSPADVTTDPVARHRADDAGLQPPVDLLLEPGYEQQVVVGTHRQ
jgi:hypothetical protein